MRKELLVWIVAGFCGLTAAGVRAQTAGCIPPPEGLISWWRGEATALDTISTNHGATIGGVAFTTGLAGRAFLLSGIGDDYVYLPDDIFPVPALGEGSVPFSFEVWFKTGQGGVILGQQDSSLFEAPTNGNVPALYVGTNGLLYASLFWSEGVQLASTSSVNDDHFHHAVVTFDGNTQALYLDGQWLGSLPFVQQGYADSYRYQLGTGWTDDWPETPGGWFPFKGLIDEASLYNRALLPTEITGLFNAGGAGKCFGIGGPGLLHRYNFNSPPDSRVVTDSVGGANGRLHFYGTTPPYTNGVPDGSGFTGSGELQLNGVNGYVLLPSGLVSSLSNLTIEAWVTWRGPAATNVWQRILDFGFSDAGTNGSGFGTNYLILCPSRGGTEAFGFEETTVNPFGAEHDSKSLILAGPSHLPIGQPVFVAATYDPTAGESKLYLEGALVASASGTFNPLSNITDYNNWLGRSQWQRDPFFNGLYSELRIWEGILGPADIANHFASGPDQPFARARPWLQVARVGEQLAISWPTNHSDGFRLEMSSDLRSSTWVPVTNQPGTFNTSHRVTLPAPNVPAFYRLRH